MDNEKDKWAKDQLTKEQAISFYDSRAYESMTDEQIVRFQLFQKCLCMPFDKFHGAIEKVFNRSVWTHEFANHDSMVLEYLGAKEPPTLQEIMDLIPAEKRIALNI